VTGVWGVLVYHGAQLCCRPRGGMCAVNAGISPPRSSYSTTFTQVLCMVVHGLGPPSCYRAAAACSCRAVPCRPFAEKYAADQDAFFADYVASHLKLSELGVEWDGEPVTLKPE